MNAAHQVAWEPRFGLDVVPERDVVRISLHGEVDLATIEPVRERADELIASGFRRVAIDLRNVTFLDSSGLRLVLELAMAARADGWELAVIPGPADVQRVFDLAGVHHLVPFVDAAQIRRPRWERTWR